VRSVLRAAAAFAVAAAAAFAQDTGAPAPAGAEAAAPTPTPPPPPRRERQPVRRSAERQIDAVVRAHLSPCEVARAKGVPCFPVSIESEGPRFSVKDAIRTYRADGRPAPGVPTRSEIQRQLSGAPQSASGGASTDPTCAVKSLVRRFKGSPNTFFLYRTWNAKGEEEPLLTDRRLDPNAYASPAARYEFVGEFKGECEAITAWRQALRQAMAPPP
jgi:hypothetical protein